MTIHLLNVESLESLRFSNLDLDALDALAEGSNLQLFADLAKVDPYADVDIDKLVTDDAADQCRIAIELLRTSSDSLLPPQEHRWVAVTRETAIGDLRQLGELFEEAHAKGLKIVSIGE